jgi:cytochrome b561
MTPSWLTDLLAGLMLAIAVYCAGRLVFARVRHCTTEREVDAVHVVMGTAMAGMLVSRLNIVADRVWEGLFAAAAAWFAVRVVQALRGGGADRTTFNHRVPYLIACGAMLYMYLAPTAAGGADAGGSSTGMSGMADAATAASRYPTLGLVLAVALVGYAVLTADRTTLISVGSAVHPAGHSAGPAVGASSGGQVHELLAPRAANSCHIAMSVTMAYMLIIML